VSGGRLSRDEVELHRSNVSPGVLPAIATVPLVSCSGRLWIARPPAPPRTSSVHPMDCGELWAVPRASPGVCQVCRGRTRVGFAVCFPCSKQARELPARADVMVPVSLAPRGGALARSLAGYKAASGRLSQAEFVRALITGFLNRHETCVAEAAGVPAFPALMVVPSSRGRVPHPLQLLLAPREPRLRPFGSARSPVLLLDDLWTTGWHAQLAAAALRSGGTPRVAVVVIGRFLRDPPGPSPPWDPGRCALDRCRSAPGAVRGWAG
jgi:hypothetical protein